MIGLLKGAPPSWFAANKSAATDEYLAAPTGKKTTPWRDEEIVSALKRECYRKCMYCECFIDDASYSAVDHIKPKNVFEDLVVEWTNLGLACTRCNTNKGSYWTDNPELKLLNPYEDALDEHIEFRGPLTVALLSSSRGRNTVRKLKFLSRDDLIVSRMRRIEDLDSRLSLWSEETDPERKLLFAEDIEDAIAKDREFAGVLRTFAIESGFPVA